MRSIVCGCRNGIFALIYCYYGIDGVPEIVPGQYVGVYTQLMQLDMAQFNFFAIPWCISCALEAWAFLTGAKTADGIVASDGIPQKKNTIKLFCALAICFIVPQVVKFFTAMLYDSFVASLSVSLAFFRFNYLLEYTLLAILAVNIFAATGKLSENTYAPAIVHKGECNAHDEGIHTTVTDRDAPSIVHHGECKEHQSIFRRPRNSKVDELPYEPVDEIPKNTDDL